MDNKFKDYYKILGVTPRASFENIRSAAERELSQNWNNAIGRLEVQEAYEILSDPEKRKEYDEEFNKRLTEREIAINNARTFEEYIAAKSLYSDLVTVDARPEVEVPQEEIDQSEVNNSNAQNVSEFSKASVESKTEDIDAAVEYSTGSVSTDSNGESVESSIFEEEKTEEEKTEEEKTEEEKTEEEKTEEEKTEEEKTEEEKYVNNLIEDTIKDNEVSQNEKKEFENQMEQKDAAKKVIDKKQILKNIALIGAPLALGVAVNSLASIGILGSIVITVVLAKKGKLKLQKVPKSGKITKVHTGETKIIEEYNEKLEAKVRQLLSKELPNNQENYDLQIAQLKYQNQMEMLEKRIEFKLNQPQKKGEKTFNSLQIQALQNQYKQIVQKLKLIYKHQARLSTNKSNDELTILHQKIAKNEAKLKAINVKIQEKQYPYLIEIKQKQQQMANSKDDDEKNRLKKEIDSLSSRMPQSDQILDTSEKIESSNLRMQINLLNKQKQELINQKVEKIDAISRQQWQQAEEIEQKSR